MNSKELFTQSDSGLVPTGIFACGKCGTVWGEKNKRHETVKESADNCCVYVCSCGKDAKPFHTICNDCELKKLSERREERFRKAEKVSSWDDWVYDDFGGGYQGGFFESLEDALDYYASKDEEPPEFFFLTKEIPFKLDFDSIVRNVLEDHHEDAEVEGLEEITKIVDAWVRDQTLKSYEPDYKRVISSKKVKTDKDILKELVENPLTKLSEIIEIANRVKDEDPNFVVEILEKFKMRKSKDVQQNV